MGENTRPTGRRNADCPRRTRLHSQRTSSHENADQHHVKQLQPHSTAMSSTMDVQCIICNTQASAWKQNKPNSVSTVL